MDRRKFCIEIGRRTCALGGLAIASTAFAQEKKKASKRKAGRIETPTPTSPPLAPIEIAKLPNDVERLDLFLLMGQSNMKGRGNMPDVPHSDPRLVMMHIRDDQWYLARHPLHLTGDAKTFQGHDNAGVGPGLAFAESLAAIDAKVRIGLVPCAVGGTQIALWQRGARLYDEAMRRAKLALKQSSPVKASFRGVLWLQGEADATEERLAIYETKLLKLVDDLRDDLEDPNLAFIASTIGEMREDSNSEYRRKINELLLALPTKRPRTACVNARDLKSSIGDNVHFDTAAQNEIGHRYARKYLELVH